MLTALRAAALCNERANFIDRANPYVGAVAKPGYKSGVIQHHAAKIGGGHSRSLEECFDFRQKTVANGHAGHANLDISKKSIGYFLGDKQFLDWQNPSMADKWTDRAIARMNAMGLKVADLNRAISKTSTLMTNAIDKGTTPSIENFAKIAKRLNMSVGELYDGERVAPESLALHGFVRGQEMWQALARNTKKAVALSFFDKDLVAIQIDTHEMQPAYRMGDVLAGPKMVGRNLDNLIGRDCICETTEGQRYVKQLARSMKAGTFNLRSLNPSITDLEGVKLAWAAPVEMILRNPDDYSS